MTDLSQPISEQAAGEASGQRAAPAAAAETRQAASLRENKGPASKSAKKEDASDFPFAIALGEIYEGPLDLLLDLIRKQDINIYDIPIARITAQYLKYVERIRELDVNIASEFIYMAAVLIHIKSKMLLPRDPLAPEGVEDDPRNELVNRLLEHEKFKSAAQMLLQKQQIEDAVLSNPAIREFMDAEGTEPELAADVIDLVKTFQQILDRARTRPILEVDEETVTVGQMIQYQNYNIKDPLNHEAAIWASQNPHRFPVDRRGLLDGKERLAPAVSFTDGQLIEFADVEPPPTADTEDSGDEMVTLL